MMDLPQIIFYCFAGLTVLSALTIVSQANPVRTVLMLVFAFFCSSVLWLLANAEFLALILVLVYVGAVMTLFLFVIMMVNIDTETTQTRLLRFLPFGVILVALLVGLLYGAFPVGGWLSHGIVNSPNLTNTEAIGMVLYTHYVLAFELAAVILLVAIIAAITLAHRVLPTNAKRQNLRDQLMVNRADRITLLSMHAEPNKDNS
jgi:NADH-quinone oxidoreductase subunit J